MKRGTKRTKDDYRFTGLTVVVAIFGCLLFLPPLMTAFDRGDQVFNVPVVWAYLFGAWALLIALMALLVRRSG
ncbi:hypothetical protein Lesp02_83360 [Lentzea sp. NBRC 105346]|uniref:hypothetical protein n=1 Tax=Lentzea sp. NBRC 105346 TaxID=3032205 RepID=UPI0024A60720|nr:hypothetical protein [Lentzea sp. NBRC 105346]GLZ36149.1 hypothetical protein Lesp02_83360 [Lentzea sp. NBRC 105346]